MQTKEMSANISYHEIWAQSEGWKGYQVIGIPSCPGKGKEKVKRKITL